jgi:hypothetical protein
MVTFITASGLREADSLLCKFAMQHFLRGILASNKGHVPDGDLPEPTDVFGVLSRSAILLLHKQEY